MLIYHKHSGLNQTIRVLLYNTFLVCNTRVKKRNLSVSACNKVVTERNLAVSQIFDLEVILQLN